MLAHSPVLKNSRCADFCWVFTGAIHSTNRSDRSDREKRSTSKGSPVFSKRFRLERTDPLSFGPKFPEILVEWIAPYLSLGLRRFVSTSWRHHKLCCSNMIYKFNPNISTLRKRLVIVLFQWRLLNIYFYHSDLTLLRYFFAERWNQSFCRWQFVNSWKS